MHATSPNAADKMRPKWWNVKPFQRGVSVLTALSVSLPVHDTRSMSKSLKNIPASSPRSIRVVLQ